MVWTGGGVAVTTCPVSLITADSIGLLEEFAAMKSLRAGPVLRDLPARFVDGWLAIENELAKEKGDGNESVG